MTRVSRDDSGMQNEYGQRECPRCGKWVTRNAWGFRSHLKACLKRDVIVGGKLYKVADGKKGA